MTDRAFVSSSRFVALSVIAMLWGSAPAALAQDDVSLTGRLTVTHGENFETGRHDIMYRVEETEASSPGQPRRSFQVEIDPGAIADSVSSGALVQVRGKARADGTLSVRTVDGGQLTVLRTAQVAPPLADQRTIVMLIQFQDLQRGLGVTPAAVAGIMFDNPDSIDALYRETTGNAIGFSGDVVGPYTVAFDSSSTDYYGWAHDAEAQAQAQGVDLSQYTRRVFVTPPNGTGYGGVANMGGTNTRAWVFNWQNRLAYAHELGHNLGMGHASTLAAVYGDQSDFMGNSPGLRHCNAPHKIGMGWLPAGQVTEVGSGIYTVRALAEPGAGTRALRVPVSGGSDVYISFRNWARFDHELHPIYAMRTSVHVWSGAPSARTYLLQTLPDGHSYTHDGITVTQLSNDGVNATVAVSVVSVQRRPLLSLSPSAGAAQPGATGTYSLTLTNRDSGTSPPTTFDLSASGQAVDWTYAVVPASLTLAAGTSGTVQVQVTSLATDADTHVGVTVHATGSVAQHTANASLTHAVDGAAPTAPSGLLASGGVGQVKLVWTASQDANANLGLTYVIWRDGVAIGQLGQLGVGRTASPETLTYTDGSGGGTFSYEVSCEDAAGNASGRSNRVTATATGGGGGSSK